jgi:hypothetical protein
MQSSMAVCLARTEFHGKALAATDPISLDVPKDSVEIKKNESEFNYRSSEVLLP